AEDISMTAFAVVSMGPGGPFYIFPLIDKRNFHQLQGLPRMNGYSILTRCNAAGEENFLTLWES
ncbi:hypothetical protein KGO95_02530, partial [Patescibacteria group bacterium]|nr:hypothetical protein [Patescibacteria group bacterium]